MNINIYKKNKIINNKKFKIYLFYGNDIFLINKYKSLIKKFFFKKYNEYINIKINKNINWKNIFLNLKKKKFLIKKRILFLEFEEKINIIILNYLIKLIEIFCKEFIIVLIISQLVDLLKNFLINKNIYNYIIKINCNKYCLKNFIKYKNFQIKKMNIKLDLKSNNILLENFIGNLLELSQFLKLLFLIYPCGNININNIKKIIYNVSCYNNLNLIKNLLIGNINNSLNIYKNTFKKNNKPILLIYILKNELIFLMKIKFIKNIKKNIKIFNKYKIHYNNIILYYKAINRISLNNLNNAFLLLSKIENLLKNDNSKLFWNEIEKLLILICK
ncbi:hypothetical protein SSAmo_1830 [Enterobacterales bacterium endosymbiont of Anomoneura mori]|uniref:DNA polymerase III subunit delta n=1 Tax=Enterobacterales bacterium endosymbiont of Anomoneura mori TaxID=3132096 RepID=UPI00399C67EF